MSDNVHNRQRAEAARLLASAREHIRSSEKNVASSIVRLLSCDRRLSPATLKELRAVPELALLDLVAHPCDFDLLLFFSQHPRAFLTVDDLVSRVGYPAAQIRVGLDSLQRMGLLTWSKEPLEESVPVARLFELTPSTWAEILPVLLWVARTAAGRQALRQVLDNTPAAAPAIASHETARNCSGPRTEDGDRGHPRPF